MYLMNVPPVAATQTEWRRCGPPGGFSLPTCFNDSDIELSTGDTPISDKVQMIIESLRSTQSSLDMSDEIEGTVLSGEEGHTPVCKVSAGSYRGAKCETKSSAENPQAHVSSLYNHSSSDSDSDDSVDRGIEEAILEYLKEKDDHKRKVEPCSGFLHSSKIPRKNPSIIEASRENAESPITFISTTEVPTDAEASIVSATIPLKKYIKNKASLGETFDLNKSLVSLKAQTTSASNSGSFLSNYAAAVKMKGDFNDSSSDDGIEEAIQKYQLEKKEQQNKREIFDMHAFQEDSDSTSDDGIEEAIRSYQLEQQKEKCVLKALLPKQSPISRPFLDASRSASAEKTKKHKVKNKMGKSEKHVSPLQPHLLCVPTPKIPSSDELKSKGNGLSSLKDPSSNQEEAPSHSKVNKTAELMCAEAILDISKTVVSQVFHSDTPHTPNDSSLHSSVTDNCPDEDSDDSSVDSEDGIEQEIRKFLEQKAQMHKQPSSSKEPCDISESEKAKEAAIQKKNRLSSTQRQKLKETDSSTSIVSETGGKGRETSLMSSCESTEEPNPLTFTQRTQTYPITTSHNTDQSGDKSSSFDSDEDLHSAIKDLLKTKKKSKKRNKVLKRKFKKGVKDEESQLGAVPLSKKFKPEATSKCALKKVNKDNAKDKAGPSRKMVLQQKPVDKTKEQRGEMKTLKEVEGRDGQLTHPAETHPLLQDDSSSVDSDDSIELEIRRFLAEKAKVSTTEKTKDGEISRNGTFIVRDDDHEQETQLAEIPTKSNSPPPGCSVKAKTPQRPADICPTRIQSTSALTHSPSVLEPADGAGAVWSAQRKIIVSRDDSHSATPQTRSDRPAMSPKAANSRAESIKWRQSLGLPISDKWTPSRSPFLISSSEVKENPPATLSAPNIIQTPVKSWFPSKTNKEHLSCSPETNVNTPARPPVLKFFSAARPHSKVSFPQSLTPPDRPLFGLREEKASMVHVPKDKSVFVELESNRTNHVQVQSRERIEGKEREDLLSLKGESIKIDKVHQDRKEEEFIDESDSDSGSKKEPGKKQGFSTLQVVSSNFSSASGFIGTGCMITKNLPSPSFPHMSLSRVIDPGITFSPCIALNTAERSKIFSRHYMIKTLKKENASISGVSEQKYHLQLMKRKLQFFPGKDRK